RGAAATVRSRSRRSGIVRRAAEGTAAEGTVVRSGCTRAVAADGRGFTADAGTRLVPETVDPHAWGRSCGGIDYDRVSRAFLGSSRVSAPAGSAPRGDCAVGTAECSLSGIIGAAPG